MSVSSLGSAEILILLQAVDSQWRECCKKLDALDAELGDGDHGSSLSAGFSATISVLENRMGINEILMTTATRLMTLVGGSAGALFGSYFLGMAQSVGDQLTLGANQFAAACRSGLDRVQHRSRAQLGDKTMLDALIPAVTALQETCVSQNATLISALEAAAVAAMAGAEGTIPLIAKHGRAKYLGERARGHMDAGALSVALLFRAWHDASNSMNFFTKE